MPGHHHALSYLWIGVGIIAAFYVYSFIAPMLSQSAA